MSRTSVPWKSSQDGVTHVNIYSRGETEAGRFASNFHPASFVASWDSPLIFGSVEAYWYWLKLNRTQCPESVLMQLSCLNGFRAKQLGKQLVERFGNAAVPNFEARIKRAITLKYEMYPEQKRILAETGTLPLAHYYVFGQGSEKRLVDAGFPWIVAHITALREKFQKELGLDPDITEFLSGELQDMPAPGVLLRDEDIPGLSALPPERPVTSPGPTQKKPQAIGQSFGLPRLF